VLRVYERKHSTQRRYSNYPLWDRLAVVTGGGLSLWDIAFLHRCLSVAHLAINILKRSELWLTIQTSLGAFECFTVNAPQVPVPWSFVSAVCFSFDYDKSEVQCWLALNLPQSNKMKIYYVSFL